jgi:tripartite-type tricarboxylate transporter receptor subunit TctC
VPFNGNGPASAALLSNEVQALFGAVPAVLTLAKAGRVRALAISSAQRSASLPDVPTVAESGYPGFDVALWLGIFAPKGTPAAVIKRLESELNAIGKMPEVKEQLERSGAEARSSTSSELGKLVKSDIAMYHKVIKAAGIKVE